MELDPTLHTKSTNVQLQTLIVDAFQYLTPLPQRSYLVIIDGLDECIDKATQRLILRLLCETITVHQLPLRFLIASRPESHIRTSFDHESLYTVTHRVVLDETFNPRKDIRVFCKMALQKSAPRIPSCLTWSVHGLGMALLIFLSNDHRASSSTRRLSSNLLVPIFAVQRNSLGSY